MRTAIARPDLSEVLKAHGLTLHPACELFPPMSDSEFAGLVESVKVDGFSQPVTITTGRQLIDGRHRLLAGWVNDLDPSFTVLDPVDVVEWVVAENLQRRHLTEAQKVMVLVDRGGLVERLRAEAKASQVSGLNNSSSLSADHDDKTNGRTNERVAETTGVSNATAQRVLRAADEPDLAAAMRAGTMAAETAAKEKRKRDRARPSPEPTPKPSPVQLTLRTHDGREVAYPQPKAKSTFNKTNDFVSWARWTWNPVTGCLHGCRYCYAREMANRVSYAATYPVGFTPLFHHERLDAPTNTNVPVSDDPADGRVFVCSMADLFGKWVPQEWIDAVYASMANAPQWRYLTLTKFPQRYKRVGVPPLMWAGASVDSQRRVKHTTAAMLDVPAAVRWLSLEPLLEPLVFDDLSWCDWVVIGSQSATVQPDGPVPGFAPELGWVTDIVAQAREAGCAVYLKPNLLGRTDPQSPGMVLPQEEPQP